MIFDAVLRHVGQAKATGHPEQVIFCQWRGRRRPILNLLMNSTTACAFAPKCRDLRGFSFCGRHNSCQCCWVSSCRPAKTVPKLPLEREDQTGQPPCIFEHKHPHKANLPWSHSFALGMFRNDLDNSMIAPHVHSEERII
jgi:hypothetical protein